jgi:ParB-like chromosome segregation protein Spo0J
LIAILSLSSIAFSQTGTNSEPVKCFPIPIVKQITKDLLSGDSAKAQLKLTEQQLAETEKIVEKKDSIISTMKLNEEKYNTIITTQNEKYLILETHTKQLEWDLKKLKVKHKFTSILSGSAILILGTLLIIK